MEYIVVECIVHPLKAGYGEQMKLLEESQEEVISGNWLHVALSWNTEVDLDLSVIYEIREDTPTKLSPLRKLFPGYFDRLEGLVDFENPGSKVDRPRIWLDKDVGVGDTVAKTGNEENIYFEDLSCTWNSLVIANIFEKRLANFGSYDAVVRFYYGEGGEVEVPLTSPHPGSWCIVALIDNTGQSPKLVNLNQTLSFRPKVVSFT